MERAYREVPIAQPDQRFIYSDINFILLGEIVHQLSGMPLEEFARQRIFEPLGMRESMFRPPATLPDRIAPTEKLADGTLLWGVVHDPTSRYMGGVAGHAGLFATAADLARYCRMMLHRGRLGNLRLLSPLGVAAMTRAQTPPDLPARGLGWDIDSPFASNRGDLFPLGSFGHTGYTGTSLWLDPSTDAYVVLMTNRVHPRVHLGGQPAQPRRVGCAAAVDPPAVARPQTSAPTEVAPEVLTGLDVLVRDRFAQLEGKRVGLITNPTGVDRRGAVRTYSSPPRTRRWQRS
ncbi:MAG: serine hydrolase [Bryobacterales bacterium]